MRKSSFKKKFFLFLIIVDLAIFYLYQNACNYVFESGRESFFSFMSNAAYSSAYENLTESDLKDIFTVKTDDSGKVTFISTDAFKANVIAIKLAKSTYDNYKNIFHGGVEVPIGAFSGVRLLSGAGKKVKVKILSVSSVKCSFRSLLVDAGINQTRQRLYLIVEPQIKIIVGSKKLTETEKVEILLYDNLVVGDVPNVYLNCGAAIASGEYS